MIRDFKYIIKRIIIGTGIALCLMLIKGTLFTKVSALDISSISTGGRAQTITNATDRITYNVTGSPWANWGTGYLYFNFSISKSAGASTDHIVIPRSVSAYSGSSNYFVCDLGTVNTNNSTYVGSTYSVKCPMKMGSNGLTMVAINFNNDNTGSTFSSYNLMIEDIFTYEQISDTNTNVNIDNSGTINNDNQNTQSIINNDNANTDKIIESNKVCNVITKNNVVLTGKILDGNGNVAGSSNYGITDYIDINGATIERTLTSVSNQHARYVFYDAQKTIISVHSNANLPVGSITIPSGAIYVRFSINLDENRPQFKICKNGSSAVNDSINNQTNAINNMNDNINNDNVDGANSKASEFFDNFEADSHGLSGIVSAPLRLINSLSSSSCSPLVIPLPFVEQNATIPCMSTVYSRFPTFFNLWQLITTGLIAYWILVKIFGKVHEFQDPDTDKVEVLDL